MRLLYLVIALALILWLAYTYQGSNNDIKTESDTTVKQQAMEQLEEAQDAADALQKSLDEQAKRLQQSNE